jgi:hypothetical protein
MKTERCTLASCTAGEVEYRQRKTLIYFHAAPRLQMERCRWGKEVNMPPPVFPAATRFAGLSATKYVRLLQTFAIVANNKVSRDALRGDAPSRGCPLPFCEGW